jgi:BirA family transcriptional regulator, biotin operon repressor / biotin---[acetyl-CoA-carboxylase] ligase
MVPQPDNQWHLPTSHLGRRVLVYEQVGSTNDIAAALAGGPAHDGTVVLAGEQTAGRGQYGRTWLSPPGTGIALSVLLNPPPALRRPAVLTAWAAVAVAEAVRRVAGRQAAIKWPNDLLLRGRKICGILIEQGRGTVVGIGLNVNQTAQHFLDAGLPQAASLASIAGRTFDRHAVARHLIEQLDAEYDALLGGERAALESCWAWRIGLLGRAVVAEATDGALHRGRLRGLTFDGLELERADGSVLRLPPEGVRQLSVAHL